MSLVGSYVLCKDGKTYGELTYWAEDRSWFVCFDDDDPVELVMKKTCELDPEEILKELGIPYSRLRRGLVGSRSFGGATTFEFHEARAYFMDVQNVPFPTPRPHDEYREVFNQKPRREGVYYGMSHQARKEGP